MTNLKKNLQGFLESETHRECTNKDCGAIFKKTSKTVTLCNRCNSERVKNQSITMKMYRRAKNRAKERNHIFDIEVSDIKIPKYCPILGIELKVNIGRPGGVDSSPALDRIDNSKGYLKDNIMVISHLANVMKSSANKETLLKFANWIFNNFSNEE